MQFLLTDHPYAKLSPGIAAEIDEARDIAKAQVRGKARDPFLSKRIHKFFMGADDLCEKRGGLLPLALPGDVTVISPAKREDREKMSFVLEIIAQPAPRRVIRRSNLRERHGAELWIFADKCRDFHGVHITDRPEAASPGVAVAVRREQIPPQSHLFLE